MVLLTVAGCVEVPLVAAAALLRATASTVAD